MSDEPVQLDIPLERVPVIVCRHCGKRVSTGTWPLLSTVPCPYCAKPLTVSGQLGPFLVSAIVARGAVAWVFRAVEPTIHQQVILQVCKPHADDADLLKSFVAQARALAKSKHPNLARVLSLGQSHQMTYLVIGAVEGDSLRSLIENRQMLTEQQALGLATDVAQGLQEAASLGATHGDLQADNIVIQPTGVAVVMNFGLDLLGKKLTESGKVWGSPQYIAPEKLKGQSAGIQSDMYSLGCLLYHVLTAHAPFSGATSREIATARLKSPAPDIRLSRDDLSEGTAAIIARLLERRPADRYADYNELLAELRDAASAIDYELDGAEAPVRSRSGSVDFEPDDLPPMAARLSAPARSMRRKHAGNGTLVAAIAMLLCVIGITALIVKYANDNAPGKTTTGTASSHSAYFQTPVGPSKPVPIPMPKKTVKPAPKPVPVETPAPEQPAAPQDPAPQ